MSFKVFAWNKKLTEWCKDAEALGRKEGKGENKQT